MTPVAPPTVCKPCGLTFGTWNEYHMHKSQSRQHIYCVICNQDFNSPNAYKRHHDLQHAAKQHLPCPGCNKLFTRIGGLMNHIELAECNALRRYEERRVEKQHNTGALDRIRAHGEELANVDGNQHPGLLEFGLHGPIEGFDSGTQLPPQYPELAKPHEPRGQISETESEANKAFLKGYLVSVVNTAEDEARNKSSRIDEEEDLIDLALNSPWDQPIGSANSTLTKCLPTTSKSAPTAAINYTGARSSQVVAKAPKAAILATTTSGNKDFPLPSAIHKTAASVENGPKPTNEEFLAQQPKAFSWNTPSPAIVPLAGSARRAFSSVAPPVALLKNVHISQPTKDTAGPANQVAKVFGSHDPADPNFRASNYLFCQKYKCPHAGCMKSFGSQSGFVSHLKSPLHTGESQKLQCPNCLRFYHGATALTQHAESQGVRCKIRDAPEYAKYIEDFTASTATTAGRHADNTIRYAINDNAKGDVNKAAQRVIEANVAILKAKEEREKNFWKVNQPEW